jgi:DNA-binding NarL/FixJ family response regulator
MGRPYCLLVLRCGLLDLRGNGVRHGLSAGKPSSRGKRVPGRRSERTGSRLKLAIAMRPALLREVLTRLLDTVPRLRVVGYGEEEEQIRKAVRRARPRVLLFDYEAMGPNSESIISRLRQAVPATRILVIARRADEKTIEQVLLAGASGLVGKHEEFETLVQAIQAVASGEFWAERRTAGQALERLTDVSSPGPGLESLTRRELQIADGVALGLRNKEIGQRLNISERTVKSHMNAIFRRLKIDGRVALAVLAQERTIPKD